MTGACDCCGYPSTIIENKAKHFKAFLVAAGWGKAGYHLCCLCNSTSAPIAHLVREMTDEQRRHFETLHAISFVGNVILESLKLSTPEARR